MKHCFRNDNYKIAVDITSIIYFKPVWWRWIICNGRTSESDGITFIDIDIVKFNSGVSIRAEQLHLRFAMNILLDVERMWLYFPSRAARLQERQVVGKKSECGRWRMNWCFECNRSLFDDWWSWNSLANDWHKILLAGFNTWQLL